MTEAERLAMWLEDEAAFDIHYIAKNAMTEASAELRRLAAVERELAALKASLEKPLAAWVATSERLPLEADGEVLVRMRDGRCEIAWASYWHGSSNAFAQWTFRDPDEDDAPTHWARIPAWPETTP